MQIIDSKRNNALVHAIRNRKESFPDKTRIIAMAGIGHCKNPKLRKELEEESAIILSPTHKLSTEEAHKGLS